MKHSMKIFRLWRLAGLVTALFAGHATAESLPQAWDTALSVDRGLKASGNAEQFTLPRSGRRARLI